MTDYDWSDLKALREPWKETFGEPMPWGFTVFPDMVPVMRECIRTQSKTPYEDYLARHYPADAEF